MRALAFHSQQESVPLDQAVAEFLDDCRFRNLSPKTVEWYQYALEPFIRHTAAEGVTDVESVTQPLVRDFLSDQSATVLPRRVNHYREAIVRLSRIVHEHS